MSTPLSPENAAPHVHVVSARDQFNAALFAFGREVAQDLRVRGKSDLAAHLEHALGGDARQVADAAKQIRVALSPTFVIHRKVDRLFYQAWAAHLAFDESSPLGE